ncbi:MAG: ACP S-malonyltransferase [Chloroflexota bacterium]
MIAYLFPGQGSHEVGMGQHVYTHYSVAKALFEEADDLMGFKLSTLCFDGPIDQLIDTANQQPALYITSLATLEAMKVEGEGQYPEPDFYAGHSLGEFSALVAAGSFPFADGMRLVRRRSQLMKQAGETTPGKMAAILGLDVEVVESICQETAARTGEIVQIANDNCPGQIVISGSRAGVDAASEALEAAKARRVIALPISIAAHSAIMGEASAEFEALINELEIKIPSKPVIGNMTGLPMITPNEIRAELKAQLTGPVQWTKSMQYLVGQGVDTIYEVGSGDILQKLMKRIDRKVARKSYSAGLVSA